MKTKEHSFSLDSFETKYKFDKYFCRMKLNNNSIAIYENTEKKEVFLVHEYKSNSRDAAKMSFEKYNSLVAKTDGMNDATSLAFVLDKLFATNMLQD